MTKLNKANLEGILHRYQALVQRQEPLNGLLAQLAQNTLWRSPDGSLSIPLTQDNINELSTVITTYLDESQGIIDSIRVELA